MYLHRRSMRQTTGMILAMWLFALFAGVANACLLSEASAGSHPPFTARSHEVPVSQNHHGEQADPGDAGCLKFCDEASLAITKVNQPSADGSPGLVGLLHQVWGPSSTSAIAAQVRVQATRPVHLTLPIAARPHRLTL